MGALKTTGPADLAQTAPLKHADDRDVLQDAAGITYFYLRMAIILLVTLLLVATFGEFLHPSDEPLGSISASWYTPVQSIFVAVLLGAGAAMIAVRARGIQEPLLNVAGLFAPVVAFVPTSEAVRAHCQNLNPGAALQPTSPSIVEQQVPSTTGEWTSAACTDWVDRVDATVGPFFVVGSVALVLALAYILVRPRNQKLVYRDDVARSSGLIGWFRDRVIRGSDKEATRFEEASGLVLTILLWAAGTFWFLNGHTSFVLTAHAVAASVVFLSMAAVAAIAGFSTEHRESARAQAYKWWYLAVAVLMVAGVLATAGAKLADLVDETVPWFFWFEVVLVAGFLCFWVVQTFEARIPRLAADRAEEPIV